MGDESEREASFCVTCEDKGGKIHRSENLHFDSDKRIVASDMDADGVFNLMKCLNGIGRRSDCERIERMEK
jgi:hypothetical protein